jgi:hypothetical protein
MGAWIERHWIGLAVELKDRFGTKGILGDAAA